jgi:hypothetical protein
MPLFAWDNGQVNRAVHSGLIHDWKWVASDFGYGWEKQYD